MKKRGRKQSEVDTTKEEGADEASDSTPRATEPEREGAHSSDADKTLTEADAQLAAGASEEEKRVVPMKKNHNNNNCSEAIAMNPFVRLSPLKCDEMPPCVVGFITIDTNTDGIQVPATNLQFNSPSSGASDSDTFAGMSPNSRAASSCQPSPGRMSRASSCSRASAPRSWAGLKRYMDDLRIERVVSTNKGQMRELPVTDDYDYCLEYKWSDENPCPVIGQYISCLASSNHYFLFSFNRYLCSMCTSAQSHFASLDCSSSML